MSRQCPFTVSFLREGSPTKIDYRKKCTLITSLLEEARNSRKHRGRENKISALSESSGWLSGCPFHPRVKNFWGTWGQPRQLSRVSKGSLSQGFEQARMDSTVALDTPFFFIIGAGGWKSPFFLRRGLLRLKLVSIGPTRWGEGSSGENMADPSMCRETEGWLLQQWQF